MASNDDDRRYIPPGSCTWCGHPPHDTACTHIIRTATAAAAPCPCIRHTRPKERTR